jgi:hypothetical protein
MKYTFRTSGRPGLMRLSALSVLVAAAGLAACDSTQLAEPTIRPSYGQVCDAGGKHYTLVEGTIPMQVEKVSAWIDSQGGWVHLPGPHKDGRETMHSVYVPANAVSQKTLFTVSTIGGNYVGVQLTAQVEDEFGNLVDAGDKDFAEPVQLVVSYAWANNVNNPASLVVLQPDGVHHVPTKATVHSQADHQYIVTDMKRPSKYVVGMQ